MPATDILSKVEVTQYEVVRIGFMFDEQGTLVETKADLRLRNAAGQVIDTDWESITWTEQERAVIEAKIAAKRTAYENATGWTLYQPPPEE